MKKEKTSFDAILEMKVCDSWLYKIELACNELEENGRVIGKVQLNSTVWAVKISETNSFFVTGDLRMALTLGGLEVFSKMVLYFIHERIWNFR
jgi:uncharacterized membrane protein